MQESLPLEAKDLLEAQPVTVVGEGSAHGQPPALDAPVRSVDGLGVQLVVVFGRLGEDQGDGLVFGRAGRQSSQDALRPGAELGLEQ